MRPDHRYHLAPFARTSAAGSEAHSLRTVLLRRFTDDATGTALQVDGAHYGYALLGRLARDLAAELEAAIGPLAGRRIGILAAGSVTAYVAVLTCFELDAAYVPLDPDAPADRLRDILEQSEVAVVVTDMRHLDRAEALGVPALNATGSTWHGPDPANHPRPLPSDELARYVLFTSGSTGRPKGIGIPDRCIETMFSAMGEVAPIHAGDIVAQAFNLTFDLAQYSTLASWAAGAEVAVMSPVDRLQPLEFIRRHAVTYWFSVPSVARFAEEHSELLPSVASSVRVSLFCGEVLSQGLALAWQEAVSGAPVLNLYGPTEATIACTAHELDRDELATPGGIVPLGVPLRGTRLAVAGPAGVVAIAPGVEGELLLAGSQVFDGYLADPEKTAAAFLIDANTRWYRSGDRIAVDVASRILFLGRVDEQVQLRGYRVEPREVEHLVALELGLGANQIVAVALLGPHGTVDDLGLAVTSPAHTEATVWAAVRKCLPTHLQPTVVCCMDAFPLNANGKIDRRAIGGLMERAPQ